jgi:hypothetical protein
MSIARGLRDNGLALVFGGLFVATLSAESLAGWHVASSDSRQHGEHAPSYLDYVTSSGFGRAVLENWQSEYLQFFLYILVTIWVVQRGSPESKDGGDAGLQSDAEAQVGRHAGADAPRWARAAGWRRGLYSWSLLAVMGTFFALSWLGHSLTGWRQYNEEQALHDAPPVSWLDFATSASFWEQTLQNWQSEFLAVGTFSIFAVYLRQRGSPESKPVGAPHDDTGASN